MKSRLDSGPLPTQRFAQQVSDVAMPPLYGFVSGEITASQMGNTLGVARFDGAIVGVYGSVLASGKDDTNALSVEFDVKINGTSVLTTKPKIAHVSGEASQFKTTFPEAAVVVQINLAVIVEASQLSGIGRVHWAYSE